jgi:hypothetical protein
MRVQTKHGVAVEVEKQIIMIMMVYADYYFVSKLNRRNDLKYDKSFVFIRVRIKHDLR